METGSEPLHVEVLATGDTGTVIKVAGELDVHTAPLLSAGLAEAFDSGATAIEIDAGGLQFCDSSGIQVLVQARERALEEGGSVKISNLQGPVAKVLTVTGLLDLFS